MSQVKKVGINSVGSIIENGGEVSKISYCDLFKNCPLVVIDTPRRQTLEFSNTFRSSAGGPHKKWSNQVRINQEKGNFGNNILWQPWISTVLREGFLMCAHTEIAVFFDLQWLKTWFGLARSVSYVFWVVLKSDSLRWYCGILWTRPLLDRWPLKSFWCFWIVLDKCNLALYCLHRASSLEIDLSLVL